MGWDDRKTKICNAAGLDTRPVVKGAIGGVLIGACGMLLPQVQWKVSMAWLDGRLDGRLDGMA